MTMATSTIKGGLEVTYVNANVTDGGARLVKDNNTRTVRFYGFIGSGSDLSMATALFTVPSDYRPSQDWTLPMKYSTGSSHSANKASISSTGIVTQGATNYLRSALIVGEYPLD